MDTKVIHAVVQDFLTYYNLELPEDERQQLTRTMAVNRAQAHNAYMRLF